MGAVGVAIGRADYGRLSLGFSPVAAHRPARGMVAQSLPTNLPLCTGHLVLMDAGGGGLSWGASLVRW
jgi:hypothetical protein